MLTLDTLTSLTFCFASFHFNIIQFLSTFWFLSFARIKDTSIICKMVIEFLI